MMDHTRYRSAIMADPRDPDAELRTHRAGCPECRAYTEQMLKFDARIERALRVDMPGGADVLPFARRSQSFTGARRWLAIAASVLLGTAIVGGIWLTLPQRSLAAAVVALVVTAFGLPELPLRTHHGPARVGVQGSEGSPPTPISALE